VSGGRRASDDLAVTHSERQGVDDLGVSIRRDGAVAVLSLDRPDAANALDLDGARALRDAIIGIRDDASVRAVLLRGEGPRFSAGGDVQWFGTRLDDLPDALAEITAAIHDAVTELTGLPVPVVVAVRGSAAGAGLALVLAADLVVAGDSARFVTAFTALGLSPDTGTSWLLPRAVGHRRAAELLLTNRALDAQTALEWGLVHRVVADEAVDGEARALAATLAEGPTAAYAATKELLAVSSADFDQHLTRERESMIRLGHTIDGVEGVAAFVARRPPRFEGR